MPKRAFKSVAVVLAVLFMTSGCWDAIDIEDRDVCTAVVVDRQEDNYAFYVEIPAVSTSIQNQGQQENGQGPNVTIVKGSGRSFAEARDALDTALDKPIYLGAVQSLIFTEQLADSGIEGYALRLRQMIEYRKTMDVIVTPDKPEQFLGIHPENESTVGFAVEDTLENVTRLGKTYHMSLADLLEKLESKNPCYLLNTLAVREGQIALAGHTAFNGGKRVGFIPAEESRGLVYMLARVKVKPRFDYLIDISNNTVTMETMLKRRAIKAHYDGEKPSFDISLQFQAMEMYPSYRVKISEDEQRQIKEKLKEQITSDIRSTIEKSQKECECDYLSFSEPFRIHYPEAYEKMDWHEEFKKAVFNVNINVNVIQNRAIDYNPRAIIK